MDPHQPIQLSVNTPALAGNDSSALMVIDEIESQQAHAAVKDELDNARASQAELILSSSQKLQDDLHSLGIKIKQHEDNINSLKHQKNKLDDTILDKQVFLGQHYASAGPATKDDEHSHTESEEGIIEQILRIEKSAASILCQLRTRPCTHASYLALTKDVLGVVAILGRADDSNFSRLASEYLGLKSMLAIVCKTEEGIKALEMYDKEGCIDKSLGIHGLAGSVGRPLEGRFLAFCLENLRPYVGDFLHNDPQRRLDLVKPRLPNGESPPGFLGFAVNMINIDGIHLYGVTPSGYGLRETLFYNLFSRTQVYQTRSEMLNALPLISDGAFSLDGGIIKSPGVYILGERENMGVKFPVISRTSGLSHDYYGVENEIKDLKLKREKLLEDLQRERQILDHSKLIFDRKKQEFIKFLAESSVYVAQIQTGRNAYMPR